MSINKREILENKEKISFDEADCILNLAKIFENKESE